jgi:hypothetical protein
MDKYLCLITDNDEVKTIITNILSCYKKYIKNLDEINKLFDYFNDKENTLTVINNINDIEVSNSYQSYLNNKILDDVLIKME